MQELGIVDGESSPSRSFDKSFERISFRDIALQHLKAIGVHASVEWRGGYWNTRDRVDVASRTRWTEKQYVPDTREVYINSVFHLHDLLEPHFDKKMQETSRKIEEEFEKLERSDKKRVFVIRKLLRGLSLFLARAKYLERPPREIND